MRNRRLRSQIYAGFGVSEAVASVLLVFLGAFMKWDPSKVRLPAPADTWVRLLLANGLYLIVVLTIVSGVSKLARERMRRPHIDAQVQWLLDELHRGTFETEIKRGDPNYQHRVTLFKRQRCPPRWAQMLVPFSRSGYMTQRTDVKFKAGDNPGELDGIAGHTYAQEATVVVDKLPDFTGWRTMAPALLESSVDEYARKTRVTKEWVRRRLESDKTLARSYYGIPVRVRDKMWGVIVIDSMSAEAKDTPAHRRNYTLFAKFLAKVLEGG